MPGIARTKTELQSRGVRVPIDLLPDLEAKYNTAPGMRDGRMILYLRPPENQNRLIPVFILNGKFADNTPYYLKKAGADYEIWEENRKYADIATARFLP